MLVSALIACFFSWFVEGLLARDICNWNGGETILVRDRLYFVGGDLQSGQFAHLNDNQPQYLHWLDLNSTFPVGGPLKDNIIKTTSSTLYQLPTDGPLWTDQAQNILYSLSSAPSSDANGQPFIKAYDTQSDRWSQLTLDGGVLKEVFRRGSLSATSILGGGSQSFTAGGGGSLGGKGMIIFDAQDPQHPSWSNDTSDRPYFSSPTAQYVRFGKAGVIVAVGGYDEPLSSSSSVLRDMSVIHVYDIDGKRWMQLNATGEIPPARVELCSVLSAALDDSSFQMTIYGGTSIKDSNALSNVYVLTMPAFRWIKVTDTAEHNITKNARNRHICHVYNDRQMFVLGGTIERSAEGNRTAETCDESSHVIDLLDTTTFQWSSKFPLANTKYEVPLPVIKVIGGAQNGGAKPASTWHSGSSLALFGSTVKRSDVQPQDGSLNAATEVLANSDSSAKRSSGPSTHSWMIASLVAGGLFLLLISSGAAYCFIRRRKARQKQGNNVRIGTIMQTKTVSVDTVHELSGLPEFHEAEGDRIHPNPKKMRSRRGSKAIVAGRPVAWMASELPSPDVAAVELPIPDNVLHRTSSTESDRYPRALRETSTWSTV